MLLRRGFFSVSFVLITAISLYSQTTDAPNSGSPTFQSNVKVVLVDVTVTDRNDQPITGLKKEDFEVIEKGKPQTIASFEEHKGAPLNQVKTPPLQPHFYTNYPLAQPADSVNVLVLDALNTPLGDQSNVRKQMVDYLKKIQPGPRLAIFTLRSYMRMVEGFTADPSALLAALNHKNWGGGPQSSQLLRTEAEDNLDETAVTIMQTGAGPGGAVSPQLAASISAMQDFLATTKSYQQYSRVQVTLQAMQQLGRYLSGFPGRKNVIWFAGEFPISILPTQGQDYDFKFSEQYRKQLRETTNLLSAAQVAIYPIAAGGIDTDDHMAADNSKVQNLAASEPQGSSGTLAEAVSDFLNTQTQQEHTDRYASQATMDEIAQDTGGEAFYNTNGLKEAVAQAMNNGSHYYTISYSPTDKAMDGSYHPITVKLREGHYRLSYRRGYFADIDREANGSKDHPQIVSDPLQPLMGRGMPDSTQIIYEIRVLPAQHQPDEKSAIAGDNKDLNLKNSMTRYAVDFAISPKDIKWQVTPDGMHHGNLEVTLVAYDHDGKTLNWLVRSMNMTLKPELYAAFERGGVQLHQEIDVPKEEVFLRTGIYDQGTGKAGTMEVSLPDGSTAVTAKK